MAVGYPVASTDCTAYRFALLQDGDDIVDDFVVIEYSHWIRIGDAIYRYLDLPSQCSE